MLFYLKISEHLTSVSLLMSSLTEHLMCISELHLLLLEYGFINL